MRKIIKLILLLLLLGCSEENTQSHEMPPVPVITAKVVEKEVPVFCEAIGHTVGWMDVELFPHVEGELLTIPVDDGAMVKTGDLLYTVDPRPYQAALNQANAALEKDRAAYHLADKKLERYSKLLQEEFVSKLQIEELETDLELAKAQIALDEALVDLAQINLDYCTVYAPIDGKLSAFTHDPGNWVSPKNGKPLVTIRQLHPLVVHFSIPQKEFQQISNRQDYDVTVTLPERPKQTFPGKVYFLDNTLNKETGTVRFKAAVDNPDEILWPGEFVQVKMIVDRDPHALIVPFKAIEQGQKGGYLYVVKEDQTVEVRPVVLGPRIDDDIVIKEGVSAGQTVVVEGQLKLRPGMRVSDKDLHT